MRRLEIVCHVVYAMPCAATRVFEKRLGRLEKRVIMPCRLRYRYDAVYGNHMNWARRLWGRRRRWSRLLFRSIRFRAHKRKLSGQIMIGSCQSVRSAAYVFINLNFKRTRYFKVRISRLTARHSIYNGWQIYRMLRTQLCGNKLFRCPI